jgi:hypothetical protein
MDWIHLAQDKDQCSCEHDNELSGSMKCWKFLGWLRPAGFSAPWG